jgi:hypothetical protein
MPLELARRREFTELLSHHVLRDIHGDELPAVVYRERMPHHLGDDGRTARPGLHDLLFAAAIHRLDLLEERRIDERTFFE